MKYRNLPDLFFKRAAKYKKTPFIRFKVRDDRDLEVFSWDDTREMVEQIAYGLRALGVKKGDNVGLLAATSQYWLPCDFGILSLGACTVPLYHSSRQESVQYIVEHCAAEVVIVRDKIQLQKLRATWHELPKLRYVIVMIDRGDIPSNDPRILTLNELLRMGEKARKDDPEFLPNSVQKLNCHELASIIYTSGTTGIPKGVILSHENILVAAMAFYQYVPFEEGDNMLSFLPLAHVFERVCSQFYGVDQGVVLTYCERVEDLPMMLIKSDCNVMNVVPRMLEKIHARVMHQISVMPLLQRTLVQQALKTGIEFQKKKHNKAKISTQLRLAYTLAQPILAKIKAKIAPNLRLFTVGGAAFSEELAYFYLALGFTVVEGYGLTETTAPISVNPIWANKPGTVGLPFTHFEVKIADDGEILCTGPAVFEGYYKMPEETAECMVDGWFHTGDLGAFDNDGYIKITGRKKDIIITAGGKNVAPQRIESFLLESKYLSQIVILGEQEKYLAALVVLNEEEIKNYIKDKGLAIKGDEIYSDDKIRALISAEIQLHSQELASYEQIKAFHILKNELTIDGGELTPTLKVKRNVVREKYADVIKPLFRLTKAKA